MPEQRRIIFKHIDEAGYSNDIECYIRNGGYETLKKAVTQKPEDLREEVGRVLRCQPLIMNVERNMRIEPCDRFRRAIGLRRTDNEMRRALPSRFPRFVSRFPILRQTKGPGGRRLDQSV